MKKPLVLAGLLWGAVSTGATAEDISAVEQRLAQGVQFLASDQMEGRGPGTAGLERAAEYIAQEMKGANLALAGEGGFQPFTYTASVKLGDNNIARLVGPHDTPEQALTLNTNYSPLAIGGVGGIDAPLVFAGYGITAPDLDYDDYAGIDAAGKVVVVVRHEPQQGDATSRFNGTDDTTHASFRTKIQNAIAHGAVGVVFCTDQHDIAAALVAHDKRRSAAQQQLESAAENPDLSKVERTKRRIERQISRLDAERARIEQGLLGVTEAGTSNDGQRIPVFSVSRTAIDKVLAHAGKPSLANWEAEVDRTGTPESCELGAWRFQAEVEMVRDDIPVKNVIGVIEGTGPLAHETVVIGAHYDHIGRGNARGGEGQIHNGADDNASGTIVLLELARRFGQRNEAPARRLVFVAFSAEEKGLLGSVHYVNNPPYPLETTVAMLNFDMVGRVSDNRLWVNGVGTAAPFAEWLVADNERAGFALTQIPGGKGPSDHASFCNKQIPVLHFFTGMHQEYHRPSDDFDLVNFDGMRRVCDLAEGLVDRLVRHPERLAFVDAQGPSMPARAGDSQATRAWFGVRIDTDYAGEGFQVAEVLRDSPAAAAGVQPGDIVTGVGKTPVAGLDEFQRLLSRHKPGDELQVNLRRDGIEQTVVATLAAPPG